MLKASILSVRGAFGETTDVHVLYHGTKDKQFLRWLDSHGVIVHNHEPAWADKIEEMRLNGDPAASHLFEHKGNYLGTWQRIDIPLFIDAEYIMFLDYDTIIHTAFGMRDFGLDITPGAACSSEMDEMDDRPWNLGVTLFNVPKLRETYDDFVQFITNHVESAFFKDSMSDQGAYLEFYEGDNLRFLDRTFNVKPYWKEQVHFDERKVVHYHGLKPSHILKALLDYPLDSFSVAVQGIVVNIREEENKSNVCLTMYDFSKFIVEDFGNLNEFCEAEFEKDGEDGIRICLKFWTSLAKEEESMAGSCMERIVAPLITEMRASSTFNIESGSESVPDRKLILHVGPGKMGTTTIQAAMERDEEELTKDNFCIFNQKMFQWISMYLNTSNNYGRDDAKEVEEAKGYFQKLLDHLDQCYSRKQHVLLSSEFLGHLDREVWERELKPSFERWDVTIAVGYRRFHSWAPSAWFQIMRAKPDNSWPKDKDDTKMLIPSFRDWYYSPRAQDVLLPKLFTDYYIEHWKGLGVHNFLIYNLHEDPNLLKTFYCSTLGLKYACEKHATTYEKRENLRFSLQNDRLACELHLQGHIDAEKVSRVEAGEMISKFFIEKGKALEKVSPMCFNYGAMNEVLEKSKTLEEELVPDFHASDKGMVTMKDEIQKSKYKDYCDVDLNAVISKYGGELKSLFAH